MSGRSWNVTGLGRRRFTRLDSSIHDSPFLIRLVVVVEVAERKLPNGVNKAHYIKPFLPPSSLFFSSSFSLLTVC